MTLGIGEPPFCADCIKEISYCEWPCERYLIWTCKQLGKKKKAKK